MTPERIASAENFCVNLHSLTNEVVISETLKNRAASASFGIALDHHAAIVLLIKHRMYSSAFALLRAVFEAYVRGVWLKHCATEDQVRAVMQGEEYPKTMVAEIETTEAFESGALSGWKKKNWNVMCDFTHTGGLHLRRWQTDFAIEPNFDPAEIDQCINSAEVLAALAGLELVQLRKDGDNGATVLALMKTRWP